MPTRGRTGDKPVRDPGLKPALKALRARPRVNALATYGIRAAMRASGSTIEPAIKHLPRVGMTRSRLPNGRVAKFWSLGDDWVPNQVFWRGWEGYEPESARLFYAYALTARATIDVGAHVGFYAVLAGLANPAGRVFALEPMPHVYERLRMNLELNELPNVLPIQAAAGTVAGEADFFHGDTAIPCSASLAHGFIAPYHASVRSTRVPVVRIDELVAEHAIDHVDLVKLDTETTEPDVLDGMRETLARDRPRIFCEVLPQADAERLTALLRPLGYRFHLLTEAGAIERDAVQVDDRHFNQLFTPQ